MKKKLALHTAVFTLILFGLALTVGEVLAQDSSAGAQNSGTCLMCKPCPNSSAETQNSATCLLCKSCSDPAAAAWATTSTEPAKGQLVYVAPSPARPATAIPTSSAAPPEWRTHAGAIDLHFESGGVFNGPTIVVCDVDTGFCTDTGKTHAAGSLGAMVWITPVLGVGSDVVIMDGGSFAGVNEEAVGVYFGIQVQRPRGAVQPYLEVGPGFLHTFTTGNGASGLQLNPNLASVKAGGGFRFKVWRRSGIKVGVDVLPSFGNGAHQTPVTLTAGWFWQSKGRGYTK